MVQEVQSTQEFQSLVGQKNKLVVVDFTATWCGPCKMIAPQYDQLIHKYPDVLFLKVVESTCQDLIMALGVKAFPTFHFYLEGQKVDEVTGADINKVEQKVLEHKAKVRASFEGEGFSLGGGSSAGMSAADARAARLARFEAQHAASMARAPPIDPDVARRNARLLAMDAGDDHGPSSMQVDPPKPASKPRARPISPELLGQLTDMGFLEVRAKKALMFATGHGLDGAVSWLMDHQEDPDIDDPVEDAVMLPAEDRKPAPADAPPGSEGAPMDVDAAAPATADASSAGASANSLKCEDCGTLLKDMVAAELHAHKTGHSNFCESTESVKPLTEEERKAKVEALKVKLAARRGEREEAEKVEQVNREKNRRKGGQEAIKTKEELERLARKREVEKAKKEKEAFAKERERLRQEIARDKEERKSRGGTLAPKLGVEGYAPVGLQAKYGDDDAPAPGAPAPPAAAVTQAPQPPAAATEEPSQERVDKAVDVLAKQKVGGLGGTAMTTLKAYIKNALEKPEDERFRNISLDNKAFKTRVAGCLGGVAVLRAVGFVRDDAEGKLSLSMEDRNPELLTYALTKLDAALQAYQAQMVTV